MKIRYTGNSGFAVELDGDLIVFDCYDPNNHPWLFEAAASAKSVTVFVSHSHRDHFSPNIRELSKAGAKFVVSDDVPKLPGSVSVKEGEALSVNGLDVRVFGSTDLGVSFFVRHPKASLFHAGDLNDWHWRDESTEQEIEKAEKDFLTILDAMGEQSDGIGLAFFPVDPRLGTDYYRGAVLFAEKMKPGVLMPMHFGKEYAPPEEFLEEIGAFTRIEAPILGKWIDIKEDIL
jgi:L-ascorbate metabolism protein UlaG (beta-lactamase superfamily)